MTKTLSDVMEKIQREHDDYQYEAEIFSDLTLKFDEFDEGFLAGLSVAKDLILKEIKDA